MPDPLDFDKTKVYRSLLSTHFTLSSLFASLDFFVEKGTQESVTDLTNDVETLESDLAKLKDNILSMIKSMAGEEDSPLVEMTDNGLKI
jgi:hypothetical protein